MIFSVRTLPTVVRSGILVLAAAIAASSPVHAASARAKPKRAAEDTPPYRGAIVLDATSGKVLFEDHADDISAPASMTKLMTYAVLYDHLASGQLTLDTPVRIDASDAGIGGTQVFLDPRERFPVVELIYAMMIQSANDAAHALARVSAGSVETFVGLMNAKAAELGMTRTTFRSPHGLPPRSRKLADGDITTPRDFALLCRYLLLHTDVLKYTSVVTREFAPERPKGALRMDNHNKLLGKVAGVDGLKTGFTDGAGYCLSATAERNGRRVIVVVMGSFGPNGQHDFGKVRDIKAVELIEKGFAAIPANSPSFASERAKYVKPAVIPLDGSAPATAAPATTPAPASPAAKPAPEGPTIKLALPRK